MPKECGGEKKAFFPPPHSFGNYCGAKMKAPSVTTAPSCRRVESLVLGALSSSPVHRALVLILGTNIAVLLDCSKSSRQCSLPSFLTYLPTASAFADAWDELARQAFVGGGAGPLDIASGNAGAGRGAGAKLQRDMTAQLEQGRRDELHRDMMRLPRGDERRVAWLAVDRLSSQWVSSHPTHRVELNARLSSARPLPPTWVVRAASCGHTLGARSRAARAVTW